MQTAFITGRTYQTRSICDHDCIYSLTVTKRTAQTITAEVHGKAKTLRVAVVDGVEQVKPFGSYSMCAIIRANREYV